MSKFIKVETTTNQTVILNSSEILSVEETRYSDRNAVAITMNDKRVYYLYDNIDRIFGMLE